MKKSLFLVASLCVSMVGWAQTVEFFSPSVVHVVHANGDAKLSMRKSEVVVQAPQKVNVSKAVSGDATVYRSSKLVVTVRGGRVSFADSKGNVLMSEEGTWFAPITEGPDKGLFRVGQAFSVEPDEAIYGVGMMQNGKMSLRGEDRLMIQSNLEDYAHFYQTIKGYGVYWDNYSPTHLQTPKDGVEGSVRLESQVGDRVDYYFIYGNEKRNDGVIALMRQLTGEAPMLPLWTYGFHQSRERYKSSHELLDVVSRYRRLGVPLDGIIQDWQYWGNNYQWNAMEFLNDDFRNAQQMIDSVHHMNAHISTSIWASFGPMTKPYRQFEKKNLLFSFQTWPQSGLPDWPPRKDYPSGVRVYKPYTAEARNIYWDNLKRMFRMGVDAWWMDSTDPDHMDFKDSDLDETTPIDTPDGVREVSYRSVRNIFPLKTVEGVTSSQLSEDGSPKAARPFVLTRSYFAGQQRTGANTWSGDVGSSWENFRKQIPICLNYTLTGNPQVNTDIGGFFANSYNRRSLDNSGTRNPQFQELYARWMQFGVFCPMMRSHGTEVFRELYYFGEKGIDGDIENPTGGVYESLLASVKLRYELLPYIYSQSWQVSKNNDSFMRALFMDFSDDRNTWDCNREFMFGHNLLVCPVVNALYTQEKIVKTNEMTGWDRTENSDGATSATKVDWMAKKMFDVYLPKGAEWYDFFTGKKVANGAHKAEVNIMNMPVYVKAGTILPLCRKSVTHADIADWQMLDINVYPGVDADFVLYEDEGDNLNYRNGAFSTIAFHWNDAKRQLTIGQRRGEFPGMVTKRRFHVNIVGGKSFDVEYVGKKMVVK